MNMLGWKKFAETKSLMGFVAQWQVQALLSFPPDVVFPFDGSALLSFTIIRQFVELVRSPLPFSFASVSILFY